MGLLTNLTRILVVAQELVTVLDSLNTKAGNLMATMEQFREYITEIDTHTTKIGQETIRIGDAFTQLLDRLGAGGLTEADETEVLNNMRAQAEKLRAQGEEMTKIGTDAPA